MQIKTLSNIVEVTEPVFVTPFCTKAGRLFFVVDDTQVAAEAVKQVIDLESMSGLTAVFPPFHCPNPAQWLSRAVLEAIYVEAHQEDADPPTNETPIDDLTLIKAFGSRSLWMS